MLEYQKSSGAEHPSSHRGVGGEPVHVDFGCFELQCLTLHLACSVHTAQQLSQRGCDMSQKSPRSHGEQPVPDLATFVAQRWEPWQVLAARRGGAKEPTRNHNTAK